MMTLAIQIKRKRWPFLHSATGHLDWNFGVSAAGPEMRLTLTRRFYSGTCSLTNLLILSGKTVCDSHGLLASVRNVQRLTPTGKRCAALGRYRRGAMAAKAPPTTGRTGNR